MESPASAACGDVDVYQVDHHGSSQATNPNLVSQLMPELAIFSAARNSRGSPTPQTISRLNSPNAGSLLMGTTPGEGAVGFAVVGNLTITTDGRRYRTTAENGESLDFLVDEAVGRAPTIGDLQISELHRDPASVPDANGEYFELTNTGSVPVSLRGARVITSGGSFAAPSVTLLPGRPVSLMSDGFAERNGGLPMGMVWPVGAIVLDDLTDTLALTQGATTLDSLT